MSVVCPAILAADGAEYAEQMHRVAKFAKRIQIDLMDGEFVVAKSVGLDRIWWPHNLLADIHLMYQRPMEQLEQLIKLRPNMVIIHAEADVNHMHFAAELHKEEVKAGLAILPGTSVDSIESLIHSFDHVLIFDGKLGHFGGVADITLLHKVKQIKEHHEDAEIGWDGGVNDQNARQLLDGGVDVLNVGGFIQKSEDPKAAYDKLLGVIENRDGEIEGEKVHNKAAGS